MHTYLKSEFLVLIIFDRLQKLNLSTVINDIDDIFPINYFKIQKPLNTQELNF